ncbi:hypothetical protein AXF42_Ash008812 [Apostasia shenzhenica]|uniref:Uncharacterized protein n=1 Tax=Apostasia shenzhenica TaxID=1088818 RepID=A0A2I0ASJ7_9ASPA|nr:hypothetical protein AXF42_Ash008812 [Apostasia shenzhenica]
MATRRPPPRGCQPQGRSHRPVNGSDPDRVNPDPDPIPIYLDRIKNRIESRSTQIRSMTRHGSPALQRPVAKAIEEAIQDLKRKVSVEEGEGFVEGRMDFETLDYTGSGANNRHDPRSPGKP